MTRYRKRPIEVEATQWWGNGDHPLDGVGEPAIDSMGEKYIRLEGAVVRYYRNPEIPQPNITCMQCTRRLHDHGWIETLEGGLMVCPGDWVITGVRGEHYPCKAVIFEATYELVSG